MSLLAAKSIANIANEIKKSKWFSTIVDEVSDMPNKSLLTAACLAADNALNFNKYFIDVFIISNLKYSASDAKIIEKHLPVLNDLFS